MVSTNDSLQVWKPDLLTKLYVFSMCLLVYNFAEVLWLQKIPRAPLFILTNAIALLKIAKTNIYYSPKKVIWIVVWFFYQMLPIMTRNSSPSSLGVHLLYVLIMSSVIFLSIDEMKYLLKGLTFCFVLILVISIPPWILYLMGVPLPHTGPHYHPNGYHIYYDYFFFRADAKINSSDYNRFSSVFLEPGQMATPCMFLFHLNTRKGKLFQFKNIVMLIGVVMSYSLIAYGLLIISLIVNQMSRSRNKVLLTVMTVLIIGGLSFYFSTHEDNSINELIVSRLQYDEDNVISGYNRTTEDFDIRYDRLLESSEKYFGIHEELRGDNWTVNASGYKKFIVHNGIVSFALVLLLMGILWWDNSNYRALVFVTMVIIAFLVRDLLTSLLWLTITVIGMYILGKEKEITSVDTVKEQT